MDWRKYIILVISIILSTSCDVKNNRDVKIVEKLTQQETIINQSAEPENMEDFEKILKNNGFKFPDNELFSKKLKEVFGLDLKDYAGKEFIEIKIKKEYMESSESFPEALIDKKFIYWYPDQGWDELAFVNINKYIFYNDQAAYTYLRFNSGNGYLISLVQYFGYDKDSRLIDYLFKKTDGSIKEGYAYNIFIGRNGVNGKLQLRKELFNKYLDIYPNADIYESKFIENIKNNKIYQGNKEEDIAFLLEKMVIQCYNNNSGGIFCGWTDSVLFNNRYLREVFRKNNFYNFKELKGYIEKIFEVDFLNQYRKIIKDPDGFTNLRAEKSSNSKVIEKIKTGSYVEIIDDTGDWWFVEYIEDKKVVEYKQGYVHKSRIVSQ